VITGVDRQTKPGDIVARTSAPVARGLRIAREMVGRFEISCSRRAALQTSLAHSHASYVSSAVTVRFLALCVDPGVSRGLRCLALARVTPRSFRGADIDTPSIQIARAWPVGRGPNSGTHTGMKHIVPQIRCPPSNRHTPRSSPFAGQVESL
jgi:hypothetical protein